MGDSASHEKFDHVENDWTVAISVGEREGSTRANARLQFGGREWLGTGLSRLGAAECGAAGVGGQQAIARALADLARRLVVAGDLTALNNAYRDQ